MAMIELLEAMPWIERLGGWGAFLVVLVIGWRQFMSLASTFSAGVLGELRGIREKLSSIGTTMEAHELRLDSIDKALDDIKREQIETNKEKEHHR